MIAFHNYFNIIGFLVFLSSSVSSQLTSNYLPSSLETLLPVINDYSGSAVPFCPGVIAPINRLLADIFLTRIPLNETGRSSSSLSLCNVGDLLFNKMDQTGTVIQLNGSNYSNCGFMQSRGFCSSSEEPTCDLSYIIFLQTKINGSLQTICTCLVKNESTVYCISSCSARWKDIGLWVLTADGQLYKVICIKDSLLMISQTFEDTAINIYVDLLSINGTMKVASAPKSDTQQKANDIIFARMVSPSPYCESQAQIQNLRIKITPGAHIFQSANSIQAFLAFSPDWARCRFADAEGEVLIDDECKPYGIRFLPPRPYLDLFYKTNLSLFYDPKCLLFFIPYN